MGDVPLRAGSTGSAQRSGHEWHEWEAGNNRWARPMLLGGFVALLVWRAPHLLQYPRFWAEEGTAFFRFAYVHPFADTLVYVYSLAGYLNLVTNLGVALSAHWVPLEWAPYATTYLALLIQLIPLLILLYGRSTLFLGNGQKLIACCIVLLAPSVTHEVWLNTLHANTFLGLVSLLIVFEDLEQIGRARRWIYRSLLLFGGFSGVYTVLLLPCFLAKAFLERTRERYVQVALLTMILIVQGGLLLSQPTDGPASRRRQIVQNVDAEFVVSSISLHHIGASVFGLDAATSIAERIGSGGDHVFLILFALSLPVCIFDLRRRRLRLDDPRLILALALAVLSFVASVTALNRSAGGRYTVVSGYALLFYILHSAHRIRRGWPSMALLLLLSCSLIIGARIHRDPRVFCDGRNWNEELALWRREPAEMRYWMPRYRKGIEICPDSWRIKLDHRAHEESHSDNRFNSAPAHAPAARSGAG